MSTDTQILEALLSLGTSNTLPNDITVENT